MPKIFLSYSHEDRRRAEAVKMLLELGGAQVFMDWRSIVPGSEWGAALEHALADCDVLCVFWSAAAQRSTWVRAEYTTFIGRFPDRPCVPLCADETPLPLLLAKRQAPPEFLALASEMVALRRDLVARGVSRREIRRVVQGRIAQLDLQLDDAQRSKLLGLFVSGASLGVLLSWLTRPVKITAVLASVASIVSLVTVVSLVWSLSGAEPGPERLDHAAQHAAPIEHEPKTIRDGGPGSAEAPAGADSRDAKQAASRGNSGSGSAMSGPALQGPGGRVATRPPGQNSESRDDSSVPEAEIKKARRLLEDREATQGIALFAHREGILQKAEYLSAHALGKGYSIWYSYYWGDRSEHPSTTVLAFHFDQHGLVQRCTVEWDDSPILAFSRISPTDLYSLVERLLRDPAAQPIPDIAGVALKSDAAAVMVWLLRTRRISWVLEMH